MKELELEVFRFEVDNNIYFKNKDNQLHNNGDNPAAIYSNGTVEFYKNGKLHRDFDRPAHINSFGMLKYYKDDKLHRLYGPAVIYNTGFVEYWIEGVQYTKSEFYQKTSTNLY